MKRIEIIDTIGREYFISNIENDEFSYKQALNRQIIGSYKLDLRFEKGNYSVIVETKKGKKTFDESDIKQIHDYAKLEREYRKYNKIISIIYDIQTNEIKVWKDSELLEEEITINSMDYYISLFDNKINNKNNVLEATNELNELLHSLSVKEAQRSQFVGSLLVALNNGLVYDTNLKNKELIDRIKEILSSKIDNDENKKIKTELLIKILDEQQIKEISSDKFCKLLDLINNKLIPFINTKTSSGEDLLNLFFTTFNKYVGKSDKNQAFTPTHITDFMCDITNLNKFSRVLDPTCGSGSFLVQAMSKMLNHAGNDEKIKNLIKKEQLFGIEKEGKAFGLATTNMLIHEDGKTNILNKSCFECSEWIKSKDINVVLMNPPFNGQQMPQDCPINKKKNVDSTKGLYFVNYIANVVNKGVLATILPLQCAIGNNSNSKIINDYKKKLMERHTLKAVFSMNDEIFHPGAAVNVCIMLFELGVPHNSQKPTFFGYYKNDGFVKRKNKGRVEKIDWQETKKLWLDLFYNFKELPGYSVLKQVNYNDEWLAEAYLETDYSHLDDKNFIDTIRDYLSFKVKNGEIDDKN